VTSLDPIAEAEEADLVGVVDLGVEGVQSVMILLLSFRVHTMTQAAILMAYQPISRSGLCADVGEMLARCEPAYWCLTRVGNVSDWDDLNQL
jgi:hypothetical protein